ncbi:acetyltransferase [Streptomyces sp. 150FB]|uniref:GNAT family N-acetyltransferase n=1 Tax=Streptomyces sp. 150FB TaxID=1576605 RepID=UPI000589433B|nr:GNAT family protein [Streptomyces sp. 150FB]KIF74970.1 acetyltransferase [Streptomyces sp. 150FB]
MTESPRLHLPAPTDIRGYGLRLRAWRADDASDLTAMLRGVTDPDFLRWNTPLVPVTTEADAAQAVRARAEGWERGEMAHFCVTEDATGATGATGPAEGPVVGHIGLGMIDLRMRTGRVGYWVLPEARGRGVARRALELCTRWAFESAGLHRIDLGHAIGHDASCRIAVRCGYLAEGALRDAMFDSGRMDVFRDVHLHARLSSDAAPLDIE